MFDVRFEIDRISGILTVVLNDTSAYVGVSDVKGFWRIEYPDGIFVENKDIDNPDFTLIQRETTFPLRAKGGLIQGLYRITKKAYTNLGYDQELKEFTFSFKEPELILSDNSNLLVPSVSFLDKTLGVDNYTKTTDVSIISCDFPTSTGVSGGLSTVNQELFMIDNGNYYEGLYQPKLEVDILYTGDDHQVRYKKERVFVFDIRKFLGAQELVGILNQVKARLDIAPNNTELARDYRIAVSLYSHIIAKLSNGEGNILDLIKELQDLAKKLGCSCCNESNYVYSSDSLVPFDLETLLRFPFIDEVIYREWNSSIPFSATSTIFFRVNDKIRWYKSKQNDNQNNPIYIGGELNSEWWEEITLGGSGDECNFIVEFTYSGGAQTFTMPIIPNNIAHLFINGVRQPSNTYSLSSFVVTISGTILSMGDKIVIEANDCSGSTTLFPNINNQVLTITIYEDDLSGTGSIESQIIEYINTVLSIEYTLEYSKLNIILLEGSAP